MPADDPPENKPQQSPADRTLLGVAPPKLESSPDAGLARSPVFVRSGTVPVTEDDAPLPLPRMALPSRPVTGEPPAIASFRSSGTGAGRASSLRELLRAQPLVWMVGLPALVAALAIGVAMLTAAPPERKEPTSAPVAAEKAGGDREQPGSDATPTRRLESIAALEGKAAETLTARELLLLADGRTERARSAAQALREQLSASPDLAKDRATQTKLLALAQQSDTSREALLALASIDGPLGPDLLYEAWTGTSARTDATELARALVYSADVRPRASKALAVALDLRAADTCEKNRDVLPRALTDGDKRALHLLVKLTQRRGCGPKKQTDCFACLRGDKDELSATINAVKARRAPNYPTP